MSTTVDRFPTRTAAINMQSLLQGQAQLPAVLKQMGYPSLRPGQADPINNIMGQRDTLCILPTSCGKTAVFTIPGLCLGWRVVVFSPLVALMRDQVQGLQRMGIRAVQMTGMQSDAENALAARQWMSGDAQIFYAAPERLSNKLFQEVMRAVRPDMVVMDECFPGDYFVDTEFGPRSFKDLYLSYTAGHLLPRVVARRPDGSLSMRKVLRAWQRAPKPLIKVVFNKAGALESSAEHPYLTTTRGMVAASNLKPGEKVWLRCNSKGDMLSQPTEVEILRVSASNKQVRHLYDLEVEEDHNFFVRTKTNVGYTTDFSVCVSNCHTLSQWADTFRAAYMKVGEFIAEFNPKVVAAFTATCPPEVEADVRRVLGMEQATRLLYYPTRTNLKLTSRDFVDVTTIAQDIQEVNGPTIVYCGKIESVERIAEQLSQQLPCQVSLFHGKLPDATKRSNMDQFMQGYAQVMVATNAFGMGVDKSDIRLVIHRDHPGSPEALAQECVHPDSMITTATGIKIATDVAAGENMLDYSFEREQAVPAMITQTMENNTKELVEIRTKYGSTLRVSPKHPVYVLEHGELQERVAHAVAAGDQVLARLDMSPANPARVNTIDLIRDCPEPVFVAVAPSMVDKLREKLSAQEVTSVFRLSRPYDYNAYKKDKHGRLDYWEEACDLAGIPKQEFWNSIEHFKTRSSKALRLPLEMTADLGWWLGMVATDGHINTGKGASGYGNWKVKLGNTNKHIADKFANIITGLGIKSYRYIREVDASSNLSKLPSHLVECSHPILVHLCNKAGIPSGKKTYTVRIPNWALSSDMEFRAGFLAGVIDGDGSVSKDRYNVRFHSAGWNFLSGVAMLLRGLNVSASCYSEDYTCKAHVMKAASTHGYSLLISSTENYERLRNAVQEHSCKVWLPERKPNPGQDMTTQRKPRKPQMMFRGTSWAVDEVLETSVIKYKGRVLNWRVEPGNQLVVDGILTHNCGRAGRDGNDSWCITYQADDSLRLQHFFIRNAYPDRGDIESVYAALQRTQDADGVSHVTGEELGKLSGVKGFQMGAIMTILKGNNVIESVSGGEKIAKIRFTGSSETDRFQQYKAAIRKGGEEQEDEFIAVDMDWLADDLTISKPTLTKYLKEWEREGFLRYVAPFRGQPKKIVGHPGVIDYDRLKVKEQHALRKLQAVLDYFTTPDQHKHEYLKNYCISNIGE